jgi:hypothetical protein
MGKFNSTLKLLTSGVCVKQCPGEDDDIECVPTSFMNTTNANKYKDCRYYPKGVSSGDPYKYATKQIGGFCLPDGEKALNTTLDAV